MDPQGQNTEHENEDKASKRERTEAEWQAIEATLQNAESSNAAEMAWCDACHSLDDFANALGTEANRYWLMIAEYALGRAIRNGGVALRAHTARALLFGRGRDEQIERIYREIAGADGARRDANSVLAVARAGVNVAGEMGEDVGKERERAKDMVLRLSPLKIGDTSATEVLSAIDYYGTPAPPGRPPKDRATYDEAKRRHEQHEWTLSALSGSDSSKATKSLQSRAKKHRKRTGAASTRPPKVG